MSSYHAVLTAARHSRRVLKLSPPPVLVGAQRPFFGSASSLTSDCSPLATGTNPSAAAASSTRVRIGARQMGSTTSTSGALDPLGNPLTVLAAAASLALVANYTLSSTALCEAEAKEEEKKDDDDDDPSNDEDTSCSICLINRQGPCRKYWLKFERCMKDHSAEKEKAEKEATHETGSEDSKKADDAVVNGEGGSMVKSVKPGEDDDNDNDDGDDGEKEDKKEEKDEKENIDNSNNARSSPKEQVTLAEKCDKFMIPWIGCIQEHRNIYSLISNDFYQKDYIDPLEDTVPESRRTTFAKNNAVIGEMDGYVIKFNGVEIDLGNWREHVEADDDDVNGNSVNFEEKSITAAAAPVEETHLINAYAKFHLTDLSTGQPIEVAYIRDQKGRLLGFDSFTKRDIDAEKNNDGIHQNDGECTFHIVPGETTSIAAYAIYRGVKREDEEGAGSAREDFLHYTPAVPLPGAHNQKKE